MLVDAETRADATVVGPGKRISYYYTLMNIDGLDGLDVSKLKKEKFQLVSKNVCANQKLSVLFRGGVVFSYIYKTRNGGHIVNFDVFPKDCGYA